MVHESELREVAARSPKMSASAVSVSAGVPIPKTKRVELFSPDEWEEFTEEWVSSLKSSYCLVRRFGGAGDKGIDVVAFVTNGTFVGGWDNYQCKHYDHPLYPSDAWVEIAKIIYYSSLAEFSSPRKYYFVASRGIGTALEKLLAQPEKLKAELKSHWKQYCENSITDGSKIRLEDDLEMYFDGFDFAIFSSKSIAEMIEGHSQTPFHAVRFGGGLPTRPVTTSPPSSILPSESRYIYHLFRVYSEQLGAEVLEASALDGSPDLRRDFLRHRERFYHAESLRNFARDTVPDGTFQDLQEEVYQGVIDVCESAHVDGLARLRATVSQAARLSVSQNGLASVVKVQDKQGMCHQLANEDRLAWVRSDANE